MARLNGNASAKNKSKIKAEAFRTKPGREPMVSGYRDSAILVDVVAEAIRCGLIGPNDSGAVDRIRDLEKSGRIPSDQAAKLRALFGSGR